MKLPNLKGLVDSTPGESVFVRVPEHHAGRALPATGIDSATVFECPRAAVMVRTAVKGTAVGAHFHSVCDEVVVVTGGSGELLINGEWKATKAGDVHVCPRGVVHDTRALEEDLQYLSIFTPHPPPGGDANFVD